VPVELGGGATGSFQLSSVINCNVEMGYNPLPALLAPGTIQDCLKRRIVATGTSGGVTRRLYEDVRATASASVFAALPGVNLINDVNLQPARPVPGTVRECTPASGTADPAGGC
jgi:hypothetical protein